ncbi:hypothetical protein [Ghiorsea bivora]|uniref:hypothetical protein n=1 Tax=Ghiorsea bivora TaxID=1485545 RepID=UPI000689AFA4|nr:hypothetical protein [Ghiorsea bivora]
MATIRKRGKHQWQAQVRKKGFPQRAKTFETKLEAIKWAEVIEDAMMNNSFKGILKAEYTTFSEIIEKYLVDVTPLKKGVRQETSQISVIKRTLASLSLLDKSIGNISVDDMTDYNTLPCFLLSFADGRFTLWLFIYVRKHWILQQLIKPENIKT